MESISCPNARGIQDRAIRSLRERRPDEKKSLYRNADECIRSRFPDLSDSRWRRELEQRCPGERRLEQNALRPLRCHVTERRVRLDVAHLRARCQEAARTCAAKSRRRSHEPNGAWDVGAVQCLGSDLERWRCEL